MKELRIICALVRGAVFGEDVSLPEDVDWEKVFADAGVNGVSALCYDAVRGLPAEQQPPFGLMLQAGLGMVGITR